MLTADVSVYCSGGDWSLGAHAALSGERELIFAETDGHTVLLALSPHPDGHVVLQSAECDWGFCSPVLGPDPEIGARLLAGALVSLAPRWRLAVLSGLSPAAAARVRVLVGRRFRTAVRPGLTSVSASLHGGLDGFLGRRSAHLRANLRRDSRRVREAGIVVERLCGTAAAANVLERASEVERRSWKSGNGGSMLSTPAFVDFYGRTLERASRGGRLRAAFAVRDGVDCAFIFGAVLGHVYRGFQLGYSREYEALGLGNQLQLALIEQLVDEGIARYDLGMAMDYKRRWSDAQNEHVVLVAAR